MTFNILIVDDSYSMRSVIRKIINLSGIKTDKTYEAQNGLEALDVLSQNWVDVIVSDINMPEMNGIELIKRLKQDDLFKEIPVIFVTTEGSLERIQEARDAGAGGFLKKPFLPEELRKLLCDLVGISDDGEYKQGEGEDDSLDF
ncbi:MAG: Chemotaxis protein CheY [Syntrophus sp. SKADARSKE-3]|nr:Chemotaxis protein CheY [Syntrophus sp. SKADARSKE-3]